MPAFSLPQFEMSRERAQQRLMLGIAKTRSDIRAFRNKISDNINEYDNTYIEKRNEEQILKDLGGLCLPPSALNLADIILTTTGHLVSRGIRYGTDSAVSHAALYIGNGQIIDATGKGVLKRPVFGGNGSLEHGAKLMVAYRHKRVTAKLAEKVVNLALGKDGAEYDGSGAILGGGASHYVGSLAVFKGASDKFYCSELVAWAFKEAGIPLASVSDANTPGQLASSVDTKYIGHLKLDF